MEGRYSGARLGKGWKLYCEMLERFDGDLKAWKQAALDDFRRVKAIRTTHNEWLSRNTVRYYDGIVVDAEGYVDPKWHKRKANEQKREAARRRKQFRDELARQKKVKAEREANEKKWKKEHGKLADNVTPEQMDWLSRHNVPINRDGAKV